MKEGQLCVNLISITHLEQLEQPIPVETFIKSSNGTPLKARTQSGRWSYVEEVPESLGRIQSVIAEEAQATFQEEVQKSLTSSAKDRQKRLKEAPRHPQAIQVISRGFRRNPDVVAEVLLRANGICERCFTAAPFLRASNNTPYLEVHHRVLLSEGGEDTVENAIALCPNCHRELHFGQQEKQEKHF